MVICHANKYYVATFNLLLPEIHSSASNTSKYRLGKNVIVGS